MIIVLGLPLNVDTIILGCIFSVLLSDFMAQGLGSIPSPPMMSLLGFFHVDAEINVYPFLETWYFISTSLWEYLCSCMHTMSILCSVADTVSSSSWPILFKVLTLNVTICTVLLHLSNFCSGLRSVADFSNTETRAPTTTEHASCFSMWKVIHGLNQNHGNLLIAIFL